MLEINLQNPCIYVINSDYYFDIIESNKLVRVTLDMTAKVNQVIKKYIELRNHLDATRKAQKELEKDINHKLERLSMWLKEYAEDEGVTSVATEYGTAYRVTKDWVRVGNWEDVLAYIKKTGNWKKQVRSHPELNTHKRSSIKSVNPQLNKVHKWRQKK